MESKKTLNDFPNGTKIRHELTHKRRTSTMNGVIQNGQIESSIGVFKFPQGFINAHHRFIKQTDKATASASGWKVIHFQRNGTWVSLNEFYKPIVVDIPISSTRGTESYIAITSRSTRSASVVASAPPSNVETIVVPTVVPEPPSDVETVVPSVVPAQTVNIIEDDDDFTSVYSGDYMKTMETAEAEAEATPANTKSHTEASVQTDPILPPPITITCQDLPEGVVFVEDAPLPRESYININDGSYALFNLKMISLPFNIGWAWMDTAGHTWEAVPTEHKAIFSIGKYIGIYYENEQILALKLQADFVKPPLPDYQVFHMAQ